MGKCTCGEYYSDKLSECPECGAENFMRKLNQERENKKATIIFERVNNYTWIAKTKRMYGVNPKHFKAITEKWSVERVLDELKKFRLGQIALKNIKSGESASQKPLHFDVRQA